MVSHFHRALATQLSGGGASVNTPLAITGFAVGARTTGTAFNKSVPVETMTGDLLVAIQLRRSAGTSAPAGWTQLGNTDSWAGTMGTSAYGFIAVADGDDAANRPTWTDETEGVFWVIMCIPGASLTPESAAFDHTTGVSSDGTTLTLPAVSVTGEGFVLSIVTFSDDSATLTPEHNDGFELEIVHRSATGLDGWIGVFSKHVTAASTAIRTITAADHTGDAYTGGSIVLLHA